MSAQLLAHALAIANNPGATPAELGDALGDLISLGALDAARDVVQRLRATGGSEVQLRRVERHIHWLGALGPQFEKRRLTGAIAVARSADATDRELLTAAELLVVWGSLDEADAVLARLTAKGIKSARMTRLSAASRQLRRSGILQELRTLTSRRSLNKPYEVLVRRKRNAGRTVIVFTGIAARFWISLNALHVYLRKLDANVLYLSDHNAAMYVNGLRSIGGGYRGMVAMLREQLAGLGTTQLFILATSAGGFAGLRAAMDLEAEGFIGMSVRTDLDPVGTIPTSPFERYVIKSCRDPGMLINLRPMLEASAYPKRVLLHVGDRNAIDIAHADNLQGLPRVEVTQIKNHQQHDTVSGMIARGTFMEMLRTFVGEPRG